MIPSGTAYSPYISSNATCGAITVQSGATLTLPAVNVTVNNDENIYGSLIMNNSLGYLNNISFYNQYMATVLETNLTVKGNLWIGGAGLVAGPYTITVAGDWTNAAGPEDFWESSSRVVFNGSSHQYVTFSEDFHILEVNKSGGALRLNDSSTVVTCAQYDWTAGAVDVLQGTFTASYLIDNRIAGKWYLNAGGTINLTNSGTSRWVDFAGEIYIYGGEFNVFGGADNSYWCYSGTSKLTMSGGTLDFKNRGIKIWPDHTLDEAITGGTIRVNGPFVVLNTAFTPLRQHPGDVRWRGCRAVPCRRRQSAQPDDQQDQRQHRQRKLKPGHQRQFQPFVRLFRGPRRDERSQQLVQLRQPNRLNRRNGQGHL
ncbi:MAG: carbohydrate-binding domain-containing protein [Candidatus Syntrophosphaera sp.]|nr:carbohydrate-binding domain-containing protein [Candidatus Syntrophosphaera sp.]